MFLEDVTSCNKTSQEWLPKMMDVGLRNIECEIIERNEGFVITAASEVMAALCLANDYADLKTRLGNIIVIKTTIRKQIHLFISNTVF